MTRKWKVTLIFPTPFLRICYLSCAKRDGLPELIPCPWVCAALEDVKTESTTEARTKANAFIHLMERSTFIVALSIAHHILCYTKPLSLVLQNSKCDGYKAFIDAQNCKKVIAAQRSNTVLNRCIWMKTTAIADNIGIELSKPRTVGQIELTLHLPKISYLVIIG